MGTYELTVVLPGDVTPSKKKNTLATIDKIISTFKGKVGKVAEWGKLDLAYTIKRERSGFFVHLPLELEPQAVKQIADKIKLEDDILRYLLVRKED